MTIGLANGRLVVTDEAVRTETGPLSAVRQAWRDTKLRLVPFLIAAVGIVYGAVWHFSSVSGTAGLLLTPIATYVLVTGLFRLNRYRIGWRSPGQLPRAHIEQVQTTSADRLVRRPALRLLYHDEHGEVRVWPLVFPRQPLRAGPTEYERAVAVFEAIEPDRGVVPVDGPSTDDDAPDEGDTPPSE